MINIKSSGQSYFRLQAAAKAVRVEPAHKPVIVVHKKHRRSADWVAARREETRSFASVYFDGLPE